MQSARPDNPTPDGIRTVDGTSDDGPEKAAGETEEVDLWWGGYAPRTMAPSFVLCGVLTVIIGGGALYLWAVRDLPALQVRYAFYGLVGIIWLLQLALLGYRVVFFSYRLTTRHLYRDHGFHRALDGQVDLASITGARVRRGPIERLLRVGQIVVTYRDGRAAMVLEGVPEPYRIALKIRAQVEHAQRRGEDALAARNAGYST